MSSWKRSPQDTTDEAFQACETIEELANVTFFPPLLICFPFVEQSFCFMQNEKRSFYLTVEKAETFSFAYMLYLWGLYIFLHNLKSTLNYAFALLCIESFFYIDYFL